jgi:hypothetical protein
MPPRWVSAAIIVGWIAAAAWLFRLEIWPSLEPGAPPPVAIDLLDEAQATKAPIRWRVMQNGRYTLNAQTSVEHRAIEDDFTLHAEFKERPGSEGTQKIRIHSMTSAYRVTRKGHLLDLEIKMAFDSPAFHIPCDLRIWGEVRNGEFLPHYEILSPIQKTIKLRAVAVSSQGSVVLPLHPLNRLNGVRAGQKWRVPVFDPVSDSLAVSNPLTALTDGDAEVHFLRAVVRPQTETLPWQGGDTPCLVIDYQEEGQHGDDKMTAETWVRAADGLVLKQVAVLSGTRWEMIREDNIAAH